MLVSPLLLASASPRRHWLLSLTGWSFSTAPADVDETPIPGEDPAAYTRRLAHEKAVAIIAPASEFSSGSLILAADTTVADGQAILGKPQNSAEACEMLQRLRGRTHQVFTAFTLLQRSTSRLESDLCISHVPMRNYSDPEIVTYVATGDPLDKAGAYAIQNVDFHPVEGFSGCCASVMGLPLCHLARTLNKFHQVPLHEVALACQAALAYTCPVYEAVLRGEDAG